MMPGMIGIVQPTATHRSTQREVVGGSEEQLGDRRSRHRLGLRHHHSRVGVEARRPRDDLPGTPRRRRRSRRALDQGHQLAGVGQSARRRRSTGCPDRPAGRRAARACCARLRRRSAPIDVRSSSSGWPTQVRWATGVSVVSLAIRSVTRTVRSRVDPPAPYVTDTNVGCSGSSRGSPATAGVSPSSSLGGKNSNEKDRCPRCEQVADRRRAGHAGQLYGPAAGARSLPARYDGRRPADGRVASVSDSPELDPVSADFRGRGRRRASRTFIDGQAGGARAPSAPSSLRCVDAARQAVGGGKRLRPAFAYWGWRAAGGSRDEDARSSRPRPPSSSSMPARWSTTT